MLFNSIDYLYFLPIVIILYYTFPHKIKWLLLLLASYFFYMAWEPKYLVLIILSTIIDYTVSIFMEKEKKKKRRQLLLSISLVANLGLLFIFKYFNFFNTVFENIFTNTLSINYPIPMTNFILPMGISFYTFQTLSYTIDVYRGERKAEKHLGYFALYVTYFPQLVAGPIERSSHLIPQLKESKKFNYPLFIDGIFRISWGLFKKMVIADRAAVIVNTIYSDSDNYQGLFLILATVMFGVQIYCDFSAYSDIAIGTAKLMGHNLMENFKMPYFSSSIREFWSRWHISLSVWFKDYCYIPLGGNKTKSVIHNNFNIVIVFLLSGIWHGANWTFFVWGLFHGIYQVLERILSNLNKKLKINVPTFIKTIITFTLVMIGWVFFRAENIGQAFDIIRNSFVYNIWVLFDQSFFELGLDIKDFNLLIYCCCFLFLNEGIKYYFKKDKLINGDYAQGLFAIFLFMFTIIFGFYGEYDATSFIYFQF